jgi:hypothetical protein
MRDLAFVLFLKRRGYFYTSKSLQHLALRFPPSFCFVAAPFQQNEFEHSDQHVAYA